MSIVETAKQIRRRSVSPVELVNECLGRIEQLNSTLNAFITVMADSALNQAREAEREIQAGKWRGPLHGIPLGLKDLIDTAGTVTTAASALFKDRLPSSDAAVVDRLRAAGAILIGKHNLHEFAYGGSSLISYFGPVRNPWNREAIAGGSSGGSAAAVAAGLGYGAVGTDTAGSVRQPAALCGVVGLKPTYKRVSAEGIIPLSPSLDHVGPITRTVADAAVMLLAMADDTAWDFHKLQWGDFFDPPESDIRQLRVGVPRSFFYEDVDPEVTSALDQALKLLNPMVRELREIALSVPTDRTLQAAEAYQYHAQFISEKPHLYQSETLERIRQGDKVTPDERDRLSRQLSELRRSAQNMFLNSDVLITPTVPGLAPMMREFTEKPQTLRPSELWLLRNTRPWNVWGLPAISIPCGFSRQGLPIGMQIAGPQGGETTILSLAYYYEQASEWHKKAPPFTLMADKLAP